MKLKKYNRIKFNDKPLTKFWCFGCDGDIVEQTKSCRRCGKKNRKIN